MARPGSFLPWLGLSSGCARRAWQGRFFLAGVNPRRDFGRGGAWRGQVRIPSWVWSAVGLGAWSLARAVRILPGFGLPSVWARWGLARPGRFSPLELGFRRLSPSVLAGARSFARPSPLSSVSLVLFRRFVGFIRLFCRLSLFFYHRRLRALWRSCRHRQQIVVSAGRPTAIATAVGTVVPPTSSPAVNRAAG